MMAKDLKKLNEYKRIFRKILDQLGYTGIPVKGRAGQLVDTISIPVWLWMTFSCSGTKVRVYVHRKTRKGVELEKDLNLADPTSLETLRDLVREEIQRLLKG